MTKYTKTAMLLHWLMALLIISSFLLAVTMVNIPGFTPAKLKYFSWHKWLGVTIFGLGCVRLLWRLSHPGPAHPGHMPTWQKLSASGVHALLYLLILLIPVTGYLYSLAAGIPVVYLGLFPMPVIMAPNPELKPLLKEIHFYLNMTLLACVALHVLAALKHQFIDRDRLINRMLP